jgi:hypothetical protein
MKFDWQFTLFHKHPPLTSIPWSALRRIGQSRLLSLTIVVPFLGWLLLFNQHLVDLLMLSPDVVARLFHGSSGSSIELSRQVSLNWLYYVYFGLSFLGVGSCLFATSCPNEITSYASAREFMQAEAALVSRARIGLILTQISDQFRWWSPDDSQHNDDPPGIIRRLATPGDFIALYWAVVSELFESTPGTVDDDAPQLSDEFERRYVTGIGLVDVDVVAETISSGRRVERGLIEGLRSEATKDEHRGDILTLQYMGLDHSRPLLRLCVFGFYLIGFTVLTIPTLLTFAQLVVSVWR